MAHIEQTKFFQKAEKLGIADKLGIAEKHTMSDPNRRRDEHGRFYEDSQRFGRTGYQQNQGRSGRGGVGGEGRVGMDVRDMAFGNMHSGRGSQERGGHGSYRHDGGNRHGGSRERSRSSNPPRDQNQRQRGNFPGAGSSNQVGTYRMIVKQKHVAFCLQ